MVSGVNLASPAQQSGHLERGDEILQVNYQTVVSFSVLSNFAAYFNRMRPDILFSGRLDPVISGEFTLRESLRSHSYCKATPTSRE